MFWYNQDIAWLESIEVRHSNRKKIAFYGSSSFTRWHNLADCFPEYEVVNLGFGGSTLAACAWFFHRVVPRQKPDAIYVYAGDNDLGDGRTPEEVVLFYYQLITSVRQTLGNIPVCFISIKLSPARKHLRGSIEYANNCIRYDVENTKDPTFFLDVYTSMLDGNGGIRSELFDADGLHMSRAGYQIWTEEINKKTATFFKT